MRPLTTCQTSATSPTSRAKHTKVGPNEKISSRKDLRESSGRKQARQDISRTVRDKGNQTRKSEPVGKTAPQNHHQSFNTKNQRHKFANNAKIELGEVVVGCEL